MHADRFLRKVIPRSRSRRLKNGKEKHNSTVDYCAKYYTGKQGLDPTGAFKEPSRMHLRIDIYNLIDIYNN